MMNKYDDLHHYLVLLIAVMLLLMTSVVFAEPVGKVVFSTAGVHVQSASGAVKLAVKGVELESGDTIETGTGSIQMRMGDGAFFSLQPNTKFRFDEYHRNPNNPTAARSFLSLIKGGLRSVTGLIGKDNRKNYRLNTPAATIGIRGTDFSVMSKDKGDTFSVSSGGISVCNSGGCVDVDAGQSAFTPNQTVRPVITLTLESSTPINSEKLLGAPTAESELSTSSSVVKDVQAPPITQSPVNQSPYTYSPNANGPTNGP
jgi:hypothetical protein